MRVFVWLTVLILVGGCGAGADGVAGLRGQVMVDAPAPGSVIYSETVVISGQAEGVAGDVFRLQLRRDDTIQADVLVDISEGVWAVEIVHGWDGEPTSFGVMALSQDGTIGEVYDEASLLIAGMDYRPEGIYGTIFMPTDGVSVGGDSTLIVGSASGVALADLRVRWVVDEMPMDDETVMGQQLALMDDSVWEVSMGLEGLSGAVVLELYYTDGDRPVILDRLGLQVDEIAG